ncbi:MAG: ferrous iron transport protein A [Candidatus Moranbacteria bacterium]|nr:ferrous iron transport protein A [Candidatus Moranbacteria bacterium]
MNKEKATSLVDLKTNQQAVIACVDIGRESAKRLADLGLTPNTPVKLLKKTLFFGPIEIEIRGCKLALGRGIASKVWVK